jgi:predicted NAD/FAD-dependent oxidoreductase
MGAGERASEQLANVGAGVAGLASVRALGKSGHHVAIFEKSRALGGRVATRRANGCIHQSYECGLEAASYFSGADSISLAFCFSPLSF